MSIVFILSLEQVLSHRFSPCVERDASGGKEGGIFQTSHSKMEIPGE
jgi:hypothetical protein